MGENVPVVEFPLQGEWIAVKTPGHHQYAYDFAAVFGEPPQFSTKRTWHQVFWKVSVEDWYSFGRPVLAPFDGTVVEASDGWADRRHLNYLTDIFRLVFCRPKLSKEDVRPFAGNYVLLQNDSVVAFFAHLRCGSLVVSTGQTVKSGQVIGAVGNSGYSLSPHLHLQVMDGQDLFASQVIPFRVRELEKREGTSWTRVHNEKIAKGDRIRTTPY